MGFVTVQEASLLIKRDESLIRTALGAGQLRGEWTGRRWMVDEEELPRWDSSLRRRTRRVTGAPSRPAQVLALVTEWGEASPEEIARVLNRHVGNARKWLALLAADGLVERRGDGQWVLTPAGTRQSAESSAA